MEELFVHALLYSEDLEDWTAYEHTLDKLFMENPENREYLFLEEMTPKEAVLHTIAVMNRGAFDVELFGKRLMEALRPVYQSSRLDVFAKKMYFLWNKLPPHIDQEEPFFDLSYADDYLSYGDEYTCRQIYEKVLHYYD